MFIGRLKLYHPVLSFQLYILLALNKSLEKMDVHAIVTRLRDLSKDPQNRSAIAKDEASLSGTNHLDLLCQFTCRKGFT